MPKLHDYQVEAVNNILDAFTTNNKVMFQMPTGTGKTEVFCEVIRKTINQKSGPRRVLILVHRRHLVKQINERLSKFGLNSGFIMAGKKHSSEQIQVASIQTIVRRDVISWPHPSQVALIVIDEAHHATASTYKTIFKHYSSNQSIKYLGVTATPCKTDKTGFNDVFEKLIVSYSIKEFIQRRELAGFRHLATRTRSFNSIRIDRGDYAVEALGEYMSEYTIMSELIGTYKEHANNAKCIIFAASVSHSKNIVERFRKEGITAESIDSNTPEDERTNIIEKFKKGKIQILSNYQVFTEGFDCPAIEVVMLARPTKSFPLYLQMIGRAIRKKENNATALILDNACLWKRHGLINREIKWSLSGAETSNKVVAVRNKESGEVVEEQLTKVIEDKNLEMEEISSFGEKTKTAENKSKKDEIRNLVSNIWFHTQYYHYDALLAYNKKEKSISNACTVIAPIYINNRLIEVGPHDNLFGYLRKVCFLIKNNQNSLTTIKWTNQFKICYQIEVSILKFKFENECSIAPRRKLLFLNEVIENNIEVLSHNDIKAIIQQENLATKYFVSIIYGTIWNNLRFTKNSKLMKTLKTFSNIGELLFFLNEIKPLRIKKDQGESITAETKLPPKRKSKTEPSLASSFMKERLKAKQEGRPLPSLQDFIESQKIIDS
jgi:superfamily II DNA or RNA helicase